MSLEMARKALEENRSQYLDPERDPVMCNLHTALYQIVQSLDHIEARLHGLAQVVTELAKRR
jgi:hypothetical protein